MKKVLDACCGSRMFYFDKENPNVLFTDNRELQTTLCDGRALLIKPDVRMDFCHMPYSDNTFKVVVFNPPHLQNAGTESWLAKKIRSAAKTMGAISKTRIRRVHKSFRAGWIIDI